MSSVSESNLEKKFQHVSNTQDSIQSFSLWIIHHKSHCRKIVDVWIKILRKTKVSHRLTLLYLANDVIQNAKRKGAAQFAETFFTVLPEATILLRDDKIRGSVERVFNIWETRNIFSADAIQELKRILHNIEETNNATAKVISEFKPELLNEKIRKTNKLQLETTSKLSALNASKLDAANSEVLRQFKDRSHGQQFSKDFEEATRCLEEYIGALEREVAERAETIQLLEQAVVYYDTQRGEARIVANAYKSFSNRITVQKQKLEGLKTLLPSPFPSPCADAPSPSNSEEGLDLATAPITAASAPAADDVPSPIGTPEGLQLSPKALENLSAEVNLNTDELKLTPPIVSNSASMPVASFLGTQGAGLMSSWLDAFNTPSEKSDTSSKSLLDNKVEDTLDSRLDSRLLNLMQSIPSSVPSALLAGVGGETPVKDEWASAQGTPVQDEEELPQNDLLKQLNRYSTNSPSQTQWPSVLPPNTTSIDTPPVVTKEDPVEIRPLLPPPKPSFACLGLLSNTTSTNDLTVSKPKLDPRLSAKNLANTNNSSGSNTPTTLTPTRMTETSTVSSHTSKDDNEPMDMDIGESDDEEDKAKLDGNIETTGNDDDIICEDLQKPNVNNTDKPTSYSTYRHYSYNRVNENRLTENKINDNRPDDSRMVNDKILESSLESATSEIALSENRRADGDDIVAEKSRVPENLRIENRNLAENQIPNSSAVEKGTIDSRLAKDVMNKDERISDSRIVDNRIAGDRTPENNRTGGMWKSEEMECSRIETIQTVRNDDWRSPSWDDGPPTSYNYRQPQPQQQQQQYHQFRPQMHHYDDRRMYDRQYNELGYGRDHHPPMIGGAPKRFQAPFSGRGNRGYFMQRF